jgi:hypothetical protein
MLPGQNDPDVMSMWTVYDHPKDFPNTFVARRYMISRGTAGATNDIIVSPQLAPLREVLAIKGLIPIARSEGDDPKIVESWI